MKIIIGKNATSDFKILGENDEDITGHFACAKLTVQLLPQELTRVTMDLHVEQLDVEVGELTVNVTDVNDVRAMLDSVMKEQLEASESRADMDERLSILEL